MDESYNVIIVTHNRLSLLKECLEHVESQTAAAERIIVVDNASEDGTRQYLRTKKAEDARYVIIECAQNAGGAGGFEKGVEFVCALYDREQTECVLFIDDDAMLDADYMEKILEQRRMHRSHQAFAGTVETNGAVDLFHRRRKGKYGIMLKCCPDNDYEKEVFECDIASFCGMVVDTDIIKKAGLPCGEYFIWNDDVEYSLRICQYTKFLVIPSAKLNHRTGANESKYPHRRYDWREYYGIRNRLLYVRKHGTALDMLVNRADMFVNIVFRNWLFGLLKMDGYDWKYENTLVHKAYQDAKHFYTVREPEEVCGWGE